MKYKWPTGYISRMALAGFILGIHTGFAATPRAVAVQTAAEVDALNARGADYGPPAESIEAINFFSTAANWFPARVRGIGNGAVNGNINRLVGNAANSGAEGVTPIPESNPMALLGVGTIGLMGVMAARRRRYHYRKV